jgi:intracellular sulfur oxidation DsrE/DsrF family protein
MFKNLVKIIAIALMFGLLSTPATWAADAAKKHHVVFHITDNDDVRWNQVLNNAANLQKNIGKENVEIEIVANGPGLNMMKLESPVGNRMGEAITNGVELKACGQTMKAMKFLVV